jgi:hypothetical protein
MNNPVRCDHVCHLCGNHEKGSWSDDVRLKMLSEQICFSCNFWSEIKAEAKAYPNIHVVTEDWAQYSVGDDCAKGERGFGGTKYIIVLPEGSEIHTSNLWYRGVVPRHMRASWVKRFVKLRQAA